MMYCSFPDVTQEDRIAHSPVLNAALIHVSPKLALEKLESDEPPTRVRLASLDHRPIYRFLFGRTELSVFADDGELLGDVPRESALHIASRWTNRPADQASIQTVSEPDQWTVGLGLSRTGPLWKFAWPSGEEVYVSQRTGEVLQATTRASRIGAWFGAIPHWLYFTPLRKEGRTWSNVVIWSSGIGTGMSLLGLLVGLWLYSPSAKRFRFPSGPSSVPYSGQKRWHMILGLFFGVFSITWAFSGMMSMDPDFWPSGNPSRAPARALRAGQWPAEAFDALPPPEILKRGAFKELELARVLGRATYIARGENGVITAFLAEGSESGRYLNEFPSDAITEIMSLAAKPFRVQQTRRVVEYEPYYIDRNGKRPLPALFVQLNDPEATTYYVDLKTAQVVQSYDSRTRLNRWLYHGLHSMDLPWLYRNRPAWDITVLVLMSGGTALSVTSVVIGWRRLRRKARQVNVLLNA